MNFKSIAAATVLAASAVGSYAATSDSFSFSSPVAASWKFDVDSGTSVDIGVTSVLTGPLGFDITDLVLSGPSFSTPASIAPIFTYVGMSTFESFSFSYASLAAGEYTLAISGAGTPKSSYTGNVILTPVPEPETYALMLAGLGLVGFVMVRRQVG